MDPARSPESHLLRPWLDADRDSFARMNADPEVMRFLPAVLSRRESDEFFVRIQDHHARHGFGLQVIADRETSVFAGYCGLSVPGWEAAFTPCVEIGWRVRREYQNRGWATGAARVVLREAFQGLKLKEVVSFTVPANLASRRVMEKIGMSRDADNDFDHPRLPADHPLRPHVLYRLRFDDWLDSQKPKPNDTP